MNDEKLRGTLVYLEWAIIGWLEGSSHCIPTYKDVGTLGQVHADVGLAPQSKRHTGELKQPERCGYGRLGYASRLHGDLVVCPHKVNLAEDCSTSQ